MPKNIVEMYLDGEKLLVQEMEVSYSCDDLPSVSAKALIPPEKKESKLVKGPFTLKWGDKVVEDVKEIELTLDPLEGFDRGSDAGDAMAYTLQTLKEKEETKMSREYEDRCEKASDDGYYGAHGLAKKYVNLGLDDRQKKIKRYQLKQEDGTLTERGRELLLALLFDVYEDDIIETLDELDIAADEERANQR